MPEIPPSRPLTPPAPPRGPAERGLAAALRAFNRNSFDQAADLCRDHLATHPEQPDALHLLGLVEFKRRAFSAAVDWIGRALAIRPGDASIRTNYASALMEADRLSEAVAQFRLAIALDARTADAHCNLGNALKRLGRWDESRRAYRAAIAVDPQHVSAHWNESMALLLDGDYANGFVAYEWRFSRPASPLKQVGKPLWDGSALPPTRTLFLHAEQGVGDMLQFARFLPTVERRAPNIVLEVQASLVPLLLANFPRLRVVARGGPPPPCDVHLPVMSLARVLGVTLENLPRDVPYLVPPPDRAAAWRARVADTGRRRIGLVWAGNTKHNDDRYRSIAFAALAPLFELPKIDWYGLQVGAAAADTRDFSARVNWTDLAPLLRDFADTAAAIAALDRVIAVDTAVAHLAGALGGPVDILLPFAPDWRWLTDRADSPWYPTARLFRQPRPGDWAGAIDALARALKA